jgi:hypothetical protein
MNKNNNKIYEKPEDDSFRSSINDDEKNELEAPGEST